MALKAAIDNEADFTALPEPIREHYTKQEDGTYRLAAEGAEEVYAAGLIANRDQILAEKKALELKYKNVEGVDVEEYNRLKQAQEQAQREKDEATGNWKNIEAQMVQRHETEKAALSTRLSTLEKALHNELINARATAEISKQKGVVALLLPHVKEAIRVFEDEATGNFVPQVIDPRTGQARIGDVKGTPMTIEQLVKEFKASDTFSRAFEAAGGGGSGASSNAGGSNTAGAVRLTRDEAKDHAKYVAAKALAAQKGVELQII